MPQRMGVDDTEPRRKIKKFKSRGSRCQKGQNTGFGDETGSVRFGLERKSIDEGQR